MGRDGNPFDRTLQALRDRIVEQGPLQGAPLFVNTLAAELDVSPTPVREALSRLAGEGLVAHTPAGYAGLVFNARSLAEHYGLAGVLTAALLRSVDLDGGAWPTPITAILAAADRADNAALGRAVRRTAAQLAPFAQAEQVCLIPERWPPLAGQSAPFVRRYFSRRARRSEAILAAAIAARIGRRL